MYTDEDMYGPSSARHLVQEWAAAADSFIICSYAQDGWITAEGVDSLADLVERLVIGARRAGRAQGHLDAEEDRFARYIDGYPELDPGDTLGDGSEQPQA